MDSRMKHKDKNRHRYPHQVEPYGSTLPINHIIIKSLHFYITIIILEYLNKLDAFLPIKETDSIS